MYKNKEKKTLFFATLLLLSISKVSALTITSSHTVTITATVQSNETTTPPVTPPFVSGGGGGGGGGVGLQNVNEGTDALTMKGMAYPGSIITLLKNGTILTEVPASPNGTFTIGVRNLSTGVYNFSIRAEDELKRKSILNTYTIYIVSGVTTIVDGIFMSPTISIDKSEVKKGDTLTFIGKSIANSNVVLETHSNELITKKIKADNNGSWIYKFDTSELELGDHTSKAKASTELDISEYSDAVNFVVGEKNLYKADNSTITKGKGDLNSDKRVNLIDFSIMAYWYKKSNFPAKLDLNGDNKINLTDFSILAYYWTG